MYSEYLSHWPYLENHATAHFDVKTNEENNIFYINSIHETCLLGGYFCGKILNLSKRQFSLIFYSCSSKFQKYFQVF